MVKLHLKRVREVQYDKETWFTVLRHCAQNLMNPTYLGIPSLIK